MNFAKKIVWPLQLKKVQLNYTLVDLNLNLILSFQINPHLKETTQQNKVVVLKLKTSFVSSKLFNHH